VTNSIDKKSPEEVAAIQSAPSALYAVEQIVQKKEDKIMNNLMTQADHWFQGKPPDTQAVIGALMSIKALRDLKGASLRNYFKQIQEGE